MLHSLVIEKKIPSHRAGLLCGVPKKAGRMSNPYTVLGVERNASEKEISKASPPPAGGIGPRASGA